MSLRSKGGGSERTETHTDELRYWMLELLLFVFLIHCIPGVSSRPHGTEKMELMVGYLLKKLSPIAYIAAIE